MGLGDDIMAGAIAKRMAQRDPHYRDPQYINKIAVFGSDFKQRWSEVWENLDYMAKPGDPYDFEIINGPGRRPYYSHMEGHRIIWKKWERIPGEIRLTDAERKWVANETKNIERFIVMESRFKKSGGGGVNKSWPYWEEILNVDMGADQYWMRDAPTFRHACAILERSIGYVGHEGGLHHAAAALGKPAVVVFGGYISPEVTGYPGHRNLYAPDDRYPLGCGHVTPCEHCRESMSKITVEDVVSAVKEMVNAAV